MVLRPTAPTELAPAQLAALPSWLLSQVALHADRLVRGELAQAGARKHHFTVLVALQAHGSISQADLGRRLWIDRSDLHAVLNELEQRGLVVRVRDDDDRRRKLVDLTPAGTRTLRQLTARVESAQQDLLAPLAAKERREFTQSLAHLAEYHAARRGG